MAVTLSVQIVETLWSPHAAAGIRAPFVVLDHGGGEQQQTSISRSHGNITSTHHHRWDEFFSFAYVPTADLVITAFDAASAVQPSGVFLGQAAVGVAAILQPSSSQHAAALISDTGAVIGDVLFNIELLSGSSSQQACDAFAMPLHPSSPVTAAASRARPASAFAAVSCGQHRRLGSFDRSSSSSHLGSPFLDLDLAKLRSEREQEGAQPDTPPQQHGLQRLAGALGLSSSGRQHLQLNAVRRSWQEPSLRLSSGGDGCHVHPRSPLAAGPGSFNARRSDRSSSSSSGGGSQAQPGAAARRSDGGSGGFGLSIRSSWAGDDAADPLSQLPPEPLSPLTKARNKLRLVKAPTAAAQDSQQQAADKAPAAARLKQQQQEVRRLIASLALQEQEQPPTAGRPLAATAAGAVSLRAAATAAASLPEWSGADAAGREALLMRLIFEQQAAKHNGTAELLHVLADQEAVSGKQLLAAVAAVTGAGSLPNRVAPGQEQQHHLQQQQQRPVSPFAAAAAAGPTAEDEEDDLRAAGHPFASPDSPTEAINTSCTRPKHHYPPVPAAAEAPCVALTRLAPSSSSMQSCSSVGGDEQRAGAGVRIQLPGRRQRMTWQRPAAAVATSEFQEANLRQRRQSSQAAATAHAQHDAATGGCLGRWEQGAPELQEPHPLDAAAAAAAPAAGSAERWARHEPDARPPPLMMMMMFPPRSVAVPPSAPPVPEGM